MLIHLLEEEEVSGRRFRPTDIALPMIEWYRKGTFHDAGGGLADIWPGALNARDLLQATGANQPLIQVDGSALFDGIDDFLKSAAIAALVQPCTIASVLNIVSWTISDTIHDGAASSTGKLYQSGVSPNLRITSDGVLNVDGNPDPPLGTWVVMFACFNGANSYIGLNANAPVVGDAGAGNMLGFTLGGRAGAVNAANFYAKEIGIYGGAMDATMRAQFAAYGLAL
jgi:hypothetical protein